MTAKQSAIQDMMKDLGCTFANLALLQETSILNLTKKEEE